MADLTSDTDLRRGGGTHPVPVVLNRTLTALMVGINLATLLALPLLLRESSWWALAALPFFALTTTHWSLIHEGIHGMLDPDIARNDRMARALGVVFGASFHAVQFAHLMHHRFNRDWENDVYDPQTSTWWRNAPIHYFYMFGGVYFTEIFATYMVSFAPRVSQRLLIKSRKPKLTKRVSDISERFLFTAGRVPLIRADAALITILYAVSFWLYAAWWPLLLAIIYARAVSVSLSDNVYHYATKPDNSEPAWELKVPRSVRLLFMNFNLHYSHHLKPGLPWLYLMNVHDQHGRYHYGFWHAMWRQFRGPVTEAELAGPAAPTEATARTPS